jgi:tRNA A37 N6-isopentenylltransferase MiaA
VNKPYTKQRAEVSNPQKSWANRDCRQCANIIHTNPLPVSISRNKANQRGRKKWVHPVWEQEMTEKETAAAATVRPTDPSRLLMAKIIIKRTHTPFALFDARRGPLLLARLYLLLIYGWCVCRLHARTMRQLEKSIAKGLAFDANTNKHRRVLTPVTHSRARQIKSEKSSAAPFSADLSRGYSAF